jgi:hypothetical protein
MVAFLAMTITGLSADYCQYGRAVLVDPPTGLRERHRRRMPASPGHAAQTVAAGSPATGALLQLPYNCFDDTAWSIRLESRHELTAACLTVRNFQSTRPRNLIMAKAKKSKKAAPK